ncbi:MarR family winged helix-turn-helix transcriptional regulator [Parasphingorhabdus sp.]|uniref:MarR family winged helix-turn-helix transcriptional regulator n=1 Tax=Parasphingorhabdus sp. TaxID=2709688 RepID=UPI003A8FD9FD
MRKSDSPKITADAPSILYLIKQVQYRAFVQLESVLQPLGITAVQFRVLTTISSRPSISSAELARVYDVKPQTMIKQIATLESKGLIARQTSEKNKRQLDLTLTDAGKACLDTCRTGAQALEKNLMAPLNDAEQDELRKYLLRLSESLAPPQPESSQRDNEEFKQEFRRAGVQRV